ncbi:MAG: FTR1 family iron permease [Burkholderiales bacterium]
MFGSAIIVFRETFEAAILIGIIAAATRSMSGRGLFIGAGIAAGLAGACLVAALTSTIAAMFEGVGQEAFNAAILALAVVLLAWHNIWMSMHGAELAAGAKQVGLDVKQGRRELSAILLLIALAVLREGSESALFVYGMMSGADLTVATAIYGTLLGIAAGAAVGFLLYLGMLKIPMRWFFSVTSTLILLLAAGMAARMAHFLVQADLLPSLKSPLFDVSAVLPMSSPLGILLHALVGYEAAPAGLEVLFYLVTLGAIVAGMLIVQRSRSPSVAHAR